MEMSENINELAAALSAAQGLLSNAKCDTKAHGYNYAKLVQYIEIAKPVLPKHGLSISQFVDSDANGRVIVSTMLLHSSGQYLKSSAAVPDAVLMGGAGKNPIQVAGSQITYMRRYQYAAILGMTDNAEDNDAQGLVAPNKPKPKPAPQETKAIPIPVPLNVFDENKMSWAAKAKNHGKGGMDRLAEYVKKSTRGQMYLTCEQAEEIQELIIELAMKDMKTMGEMA